MIYQNIKIRKSNNKIKTVAEQKISKTKQQ